VLVEEILKVPSSKTSTAEPSDVLLIRTVNRARVIVLLVACAGSVAENFLTNVAIYPSKSAYQPGSTCNNIRSALSVLNEMSRQKPDAVRP
jgi:hypothetical protein